MDNSILPTFEMLVDNLEEGVQFISVVGDPAIEINWFAFNSEFSPYNFKFANEDKRMIAGPFMIPDLKIFRRDQNTGEEFNVYFTKDTIEKIVKKFFKEKRVLNVNEEHTNKIAPAYVMESWIVEDPEKDKSNTFGFTLPKGTWFGVMHVEDESYWNEFIKTGKVKGFSVEGLMSLSDKPTQNQMKKTNKKYEHFVKTIDGLDLVNGDGAEILNPGDDIYILAEDGSTTPAPDGDYILEGGATLKVVAGKAEEIKVAEGMAQVEETPTELAADPKMVAILMAEIQPSIDSLKEEFLNAINELNNKVAELENNLTEAGTKMASQEEVIEKQNEELKEFASMIPGSKSKTIVANIEAAEASSKISKLRNTFEAIQSYKKNKN